MGGAHSKQSLSASSSPSSRIRKTLGSRNHQQDSDKRGEGKGDTIDRSRPPLLEIQRQTMNKERESSANRDAIESEGQCQLEDEEHVKSVAIASSRRSSRRRTRSMTQSHQEGSEEDAEDSEPVTSRRIRRRMKGKSKQVDKDTLDIDATKSTLNKGKEKQIDEDAETETRIYDRDSQMIEKVPSPPCATSIGEETPAPLLPPLLDEPLPSSSTHLGQQQGSTLLPPPEPSRFIAASNPFDVSPDERLRARSQIAQALGLGAAIQLAGGRIPPPDQPRQSMLSALLSDILGIRGGQMAASSDSNPGSRSHGTSNGGNNNSATARDGSRSRSVNGGTSVIVQGALISRTLPSRPDGVRVGSPNDNRSESERRSESQPPPTSMNNNSESALSEEETRHSATDGETQVATIEEQAAMLIRLLSIATAATAASLVSTPRQQHNRSQQTDSTNTANTNLQNSTTRPSESTSQTMRVSPQIGTLASPRSISVAPSSSTSSSWRNASQTYQTLRERFSAFRSRFRGQRLARQAEQLQDGTPALTTTSVATVDNEQVNHDGTRREETTTDVDDGSHEHDPSGSLSTLSSMLHDAIRGGVPSSERSTTTVPERSESMANNAGQDANSRAQSVHATLDAVRGGQLSRGEDGTFNRFLYDLMSDLDVAVRGLPREREDDRVDEVSQDDMTRSRRQRDLQDGQLSFFRLFTFPAASRSEEAGQSPSSSALLPCVVVGVRSLESNQTLQTGLVGASTAIPASAPGNGGVDLSPSEDDTIMHDETRTLETAATTSDGIPTSGRQEEATTSDSQAGPPMSRFLLFVSGGHYPPQHPLFHSSNDEASRDLMVLMEFLGAMASMHTKPNTTVTKDQIEKSKLVKVTGGLCEIKKLVQENKVMENTSERCLICLEDWKEGGEDCRLLECAHLFHSPCIDQWLTASNNSCPLCRRQAVVLPGAPSPGLVPGHSTV